MNYQKFSLAFGFSIWLIATLIFRFWGHYFFFIENNLLITTFFIGIIPVLYFLAKSIFNQFQLVRADQLKSAILMALPGMVFDVFCIKYHAIVFPNLTIEQSIVLGSWVIWTYSLVILLGLLIRIKPKES
jgi:hypothetical protein